MTAIQTDMFKPTIAQRWDAFIQTPEGGQFANDFLRLAHGYKAGGKRVGAKRLFEELRANPKYDHGKFRVNNDYTAYAARWAAERDTTLEDYFEFRGVGREDVRAEIVKDALQLMHLAWEYLEIGHEAAAQIQITLAIRKLGKLNKQKGTEE